jgi:hypothetical protein
MRIIIAVVLLVILADCASSRDFTVVLHNDTSSGLTDVQVMFDGFRSLSVGIAPKAHKGEGGVSGAIPQSAVVTWRTSDGQLHTQTLNVRSALPGGYRGDVWFVIRASNSVEVHPKHPHE